MLNQVSPTVFQESSNFNESQIDIAMPATGSIRTRGGSATHTVYDDDGVAYTILQTVVDRSTGVQRIEILDTPKFGRTLWLNNTLMSSSLDQRLYHELMVVPACVLSHVWCMPRIKRALVLGVGPGGILPVLLPFVASSVRNVRAVEMDAAVCQEAKKHLPAWSQMPDGSSAFDSVQVEFFEADAVKHAAQLIAEEKQYDLIICDFHVGAEQFPDSFLRMLSCLMSPLGVVVSHFGPAGMLGVDNARNAYHRFCSLGDTRIWQSFIPSFGDVWGWVCASKRVVNYNFDCASMACIDAPLPFDHIRCLDIDDALRLLDNSSPKYLRI
jgi:spermidine synthase